MKLYYCVRSSKSLLFGAHLIDGKPNSVHVLSLLPQLSAVLLNQTNHKAAARLAIRVIIIFLVQFDHKLRIYVECVCRRQTASLYFRKIPSHQ